MTRGSPGAKSVPKAFVATAMISVAFAYARRFEAGLSHALAMSPEEARKARLARQIVRR